MVCGARRDLAVIGIKFVQQFGERLGQVMNQNPSVAKD